MDARAQQVQAYLAGEGLEPRNFGQPTPTSSSAAAVCGCRVGEIAKSILLLVGKQPVLVVTSGDTKVKSGRLKQAGGLRGQVRLPEADEVIRFTGYSPGSVSPFLLPENLPVYLDRSLLRFDLIYPAAATGSSLVPLTFTRLKELSGGTLVDVCDVLESTD